MVTSPFTWRSEFTPPDKWLGGKPGITSRDALLAALSADFTLLQVRATHLYGSTLTLCARGWIGLRHTVLTLATVPLTFSCSSVQEEDMPLAIRETARKYELIVAHAGIWQRKQ